MFRDISISLPVDSSCERKLNIKGFVPGELVIGDWALSVRKLDMGPQRMRIPNSRPLVMMLGSTTGGVFSQGN
jgi:hypothetical protein